MNQLVFQDILESYTKDFDDNWIKENYKWKVVKTFQQWDSYAQDFYLMFQHVTKNVGNLLASAADWPVTDILNLIKKDQYAIKEAFRELYNTDNHVLECARNFRDALIAKNREYGYKPRAGNYVRTIATLLAFRFPEQYAIFKLDIAKNFAEITDNGINFFKDDLLSIEKYNNMVKDIISYIPKDHPIMNKYRQKLKENVDIYYQDSDYFMLAQDVIFYTGVYYNQKPIQREQTKIVAYKSVNFNPDQINKKVTLQQSKNDYEQRYKENSRIGRLGEQFVLTQELQRLKEIGIDKEPYWTSVNKGDGLGFDILSYDENGQEIFIEVKTTTGHINTTFYITANEYICSRKYSSKYRLYRVYNFKNNVGDIAVFKGSLKSLCIRPTSFMVSGQNMFKI